MTYSPITTEWLDLPADIRSAAETAVGHLRPMTHAEDALEAARYLLWYKDKGGNTDHCQEAWNKLRDALSITEADLSAPERFANWLNEGPKLAKAAGLYVGISVKPLAAAKSKPLPPSPKPAAVSEGGEDE